MKNFALSFVIFCLALSASAQKASLQGFVIDAETSENIIGANVFLEDRSYGVSTDQKGYFNIITELPVKIFVSCIGYTDTCFVVSQADGKMLQIRLKPSVHILQSAEIVASKIDKLTEFNKITLTQKDIELLPTIGSRPDIIKAAQQLPGIEPLTEASSVMLVRGGGPGENLYILDNVPIIYVNHIGGFMSVFNPEMINTMDIYKGGFPARYGGKLSSIVDLTSKKGDPTTFKGSLSAGLTDIAFSVEGPGGLKNSSFIFTGRKTLTELLFLGIVGLQNVSGSDNNNIIYGFHDIHAKYTWSPNAKNNLSLNVYEGDDYLRIWKNTNSGSIKERNSIGNIWGNLLVSAQWNSAVSSRLFATNTLSYTRYRLRKNTNAYSQTSIDTTSFTSLGKSSVHDFSLRSQWKCTLMQGWSLDFGAQLSNVRYMPNYYYNDNITIKPGKDISSVFDNAVYLDNVFKVGRILDGTIGARLNYYINKDFQNLSFEPRLNLNLHIGRSTVNLTAMHVAQNSHLLMTPGSILNNEIWISAEKGIAPSTSNQISIGWQRGFAQDKIHIEADIYYKKMHDLVTYKEGQSCLIGDGEWRNKIESGGNGKSYGFELMARGDFGKFNGYIGYTYSHTTRQFDNINSGMEYIYEYDRPHSININANYAFNEKWSLSASWTYQTGLPYTPIIGVQMIPIIDFDGSVYFEESHIYGERNSMRMRDYHRLDISAKKKIITKNGRKAEWTFSIYNVYCRQNPYYYYYGDRVGDPLSYGSYPDEAAVLWQRCYFPLIPSFSYKVWF